MHITFSLLVTADTGSGFGFVGPLSPIKCKLQKSCLLCKQNYHLDGTRLSIYMSFLPIVQYQENDKIVLGHCFYYSYEGAGILNDFYMFPKNIF